MEVGAENLVTSLKTLFANYKVHFRKVINFRWHLESAKHAKVSKLLEQYGRQAEVSIDRLVTELDRFGELPLVDMSSCMRWAQIKRYEGEMALEHIFNEVISDSMTIKDQLLIIRTKAVQQNKFELYKTCDQLHRHVEGRINKLQALFLETIG
jgi:DNA-binding ferritin-like protein